MPGNLSGRTDGRTDRRTCCKTVTFGGVDQRTHVHVKRGYFRLRTNGRTDGQPENIMPPAPKGGGKINKANLRDLIAATGLVILLKLDSNRRFSVGKRLIWVKIDEFFSRVTLKFDGWPSKTIGHLFYATSSFVHHFIAIGEFKLELQSGNAQSRSKSTIFFSHVTLKFDGWPSKTIGHLFYVTSSFVHHFVAIGEFRLELQSRNAQSGSKSTIFFSRVTLKFDGWPWKTIGHLSLALSSYMHHFIVICEFKLKLQSGNA